MPLFGRRPAKAQPAIGEPIGRKFTSRQPLKQCIDNFRTVITQQEGDVEFFTPEWADNSREAPAVLIGCRTLSSHKPTYLAVWDTGSAREMYFVAPDYATRSTPPMVGAWKMRDNSLTSVGSVTSFAVS